MTLMLLFNLDILATIVKKNYNFNKISKYFDSFMMKIPKVKARKTFNRKKLFFRFLLDNSKYFEDKIILSMTKYFF